MLDEERGRGKSLSGAGVGERPSHRGPISAKPEPHEDEHRAPDEPVRHDLRRRHTQHRVQIERQQAPDQERADERRESPSRIVVAGGSIRFRGGHDAPDIRKEPPLLPRAEVRS